MGRTSAGAGAGMALLAAALVLAWPAAAKARAEAPQPRFEAPERPLAPSPATTSALRAFRGSWLAGALRFQYELAADVGLRDAPFVGTHNSYNSVAEMGSTISTSDANQELSIRDQLHLQVRSLELDVHWFRRPTTGQFEPVVCHAFPNHVPCSTEKALGRVLDEVRAWLAAHPDQVLFLYLEDHLDNQAGYDTAASIIEQELGDILYAPPAGGCHELPLDLSRDRIRRAGKQVLIVGRTSCGIGSAWPSKVFDWVAHLETRLQEFSDFPGCGTDFTRAQYDSTQVRYFEDRRPSQVRQGRPVITPEVAAQMARCGVDLVGLDQVMPDDPRLQALVWSWGRRQPAKRGGCAVQRLKRKSLRTRWKAIGCRSARRPACRKGKRWIVAAKAVSLTRARAECRKRRARFAAPRTGYEAQLLRQRMRRARVSQVRLGLVKRGGKWVAVDRRT